MATFVLTAPMTAVISPELRYQIGRALEEFPELGDRKVTVGLTAMPGIDGLAVAEEMRVRLNVNRRRVSYFTIGHELIPIDNFRHVLRLSQKHPFVGPRPMEYLRRSWGRRAITQGVVEGAMKTPPRTLGQILGLRGPDTPDVFNRWRLSRKDNRVRVAVEKLDRVWQTWSREQRQLLLRTAEQITYAQEATNAWNPKDPEHRKTLQRYKRLAEEGLHAARLAESIIERFQPGWNEPQSLIGASASTASAPYVNAIKTAPAAMPVRVSDTTGLSRKNSQAFWWRV